jgi:hypothetical protein
MSGDHWIARNPGELAERIVNFQRHLEDRNEWPIMWKAQLYEPPRSIDQNALIHAMYADIAKQSDGEGVVDVRRRCKLHYGVPILRAHDEEFRSVYDKMVKPHDYEDKLAIMDFLPVTSRMKKPQATEYIDTVQREYAQRGVRFAA